MRSGMRFGLSASEKRDVWIRWKAGQTLHEIGRAFEEPHSRSRCVAASRRHSSSCSSPLTASTPSRRARRYFPRDCFRLVDSGSPVAWNRAVSTVSREVIAMVAVLPIVPMMQIAGLGFGLAPEEMLLLGNGKSRDIVAASKPASASGRRSRFPVAKDPVSQQREHARVPRNHLPDCSFKPVER